MTAIPLLKTSREQYLTSQAVHIISAAKDIAVASPMAQQHLDCLSMLSGLTDLHTTAYNGWKKLGNADKSQTHRIALNAIQQLRLYHLEQLSVLYR